MSPEEVYRRLTCGDTLTFTATERTFKVRFDNTKGLPFYLLEDVNTGEQHSRCMGRSDAFAWFGRMLRIE